MREISIFPEQKNNDQESVKSLEKALVKAIKEIRPPVVNTESPIIEVKSEKEKTAYRIEINRDGHGRVESMAVLPI